MSRDAEATVSAVLLKEAVEKSNNHEPRTLMCELAETESVLARHVSKVRKEIGTKLIAAKTSPELVGFITDSIARLASVCVMSMQAGHFEMWYEFFGESKLADLFVPVDDCGDAHPDGDGRSSVAA